MLKKHMGSVHNTEPISTSVGDRVEDLSSKVIQQVINCDMCGATEIQENDMNTHMETHHTEDHSSKKSDKETFKQKEFDEVFKQLQGVKASKDELEDKLVVDKTWSSVSNST